MALLVPGIFSKPPNGTTVVILLVAALVSAVLLCFPWLWMWIKVPTLPDVARKVDETRAGLKDAASGQEKLDLIRTEIDELRKRVDDIASLLKTGGAISTTLDAIKAKLP
jgi:hypothetical protein